MLKVLTWPHKCLSTKSEPVMVFNDQLKQLVADMHATMLASNGIGLAANQVGVLQRVIVANVPGTTSLNNVPLTLINPVVVERDGELVGKEGCLSFPSITYEMSRAISITVAAQDVTGTYFEIKVEGLLAICLQHEIDHIDGITWANKLGKLGQQMLAKKMRKIVGR